MERPPLRLASLPGPLRLGLAAVVLVLLGGVAASVTHLVEHHAGRDERAGFSIDDVRGAYHGIRTKAPLLASLERNHPEDLPPAARAALTAWLASDDLLAGYDALDLGDMAAAEILDRHCVGCHARGSDDEGGRALPLEYWDDVRAVAASRDVSPTDPAIVLASLHTHALGMGLLTLAAIGLGMATRWRRSFLSWASALAGVGLLVDLAAWLPARSFESLVPVLVAGGGAWVTATTCLLVATLIDLARPVRSRIPD